MGLLEGRVAIITGAGNGIGRATALLFAKEGAHVVVNDAGVARDGGDKEDNYAAKVQREIEEQGGSATASQARVEDSDAVRQMVEDTVTAKGKVDILINNAGILRDRTLLKMSEQDFDAVVQVHLKGTFLCTQAVAQHMKRQGHGCIINTTSIAGMQGNFGQANYAAAKAGIFGLTRTTSVELQRFGIRVNAVAPLAKTRLTEDLPMFQQVESMQAEHVAPVHLFLASELAGDTTGTVISVAGGRLSTYRFVESPGQFKEEDNGVWSAQEIADHFTAIRKS